jgi:hypothetical protein
VQIVLETLVRQYDTNCCSLCGYCRLDEDDCVYLSTQELEFVIKSFWEQMSFTIEKYEELIFKYVGDAVIAIFVSNNDVICRHAIECGQDLVKTLKILSTQSLLRKEFQGYQSSLESIMAMLWWFPLETMST